MKEFTLKGSPVLGAAIGYFESYNDAYQALMLYNNAPNDIRKSSVSFSDLCATMLSNRSGSIAPECVNITFAELYNQYFEYKYEKSNKEIIKCFQKFNSSSFQ